MSKTFKYCVIFFITTVWLVLWRVLSTFINLSDNVSNWLFSLMIQVVGNGIIPLVLVKFWIKDDILTSYSIKVKIPPIIWLLAVALGLLVSYLTTGVSLIWQNILILLGYTHVNSVGTIYSDFGVFVMEIFTTALLPAMFEELTDRGLTMKMFEGIEDKRVVAVLIATLFALAHQNIVQTGYAFFGGLVFAFLALKTGSIVPGMIIHFINNGLNILAEYSSQHNGFYAVIDGKINEFIGNYFIVAIATWIVAGFLIVVILKYIGRIMKAEKDAHPPEEGPYYFPNTTRYVDDLFGVSRKNMTEKIAPAWYEYAFLYASVVITVLTTVFTFVWGMAR